MASGTRQKPGHVLSGEAVDELDEKARPVKDANFFLIMNAHHEEIPFLLPTAASGMLWIVLLNTSCRIRTLLTTRRRVVVPRSAGGAPAFP